MCFDNLWEGGSVFDTWQRWMQDNHPLSKKQKHHSTARITIHKKPLQIYISSGIVPSDLRNGNWHKQPLPIIISTTRCSGRTSFLSRICLSSPLIAFCFFKVLRYGATFICDDIFLTDHSIWFIVYNLFFPQSTMCQESMLCVWYNACQ